MARKNLLGAILLMLAGVVSAQNLLTNGNMESAEGWNIYPLVADTVFYELGHTEDSPVNGEGGCVKVFQRGADKKDIIFWQWVQLEAGKSYEVDAAIKTGAVENFWCEIYLTTVVPTRGTTFVPNNNEDVVIGVSTYVGCGNQVDGKMSDLACVNRLPFIAPGNEGESVDVILGIKTGTYGQNLETLIDDLSLTLFEDWYLLSSKYGQLDNEGLKITGMNPFITVADFVKGLEYEGSANVEIIGQSGNVVPDQENVLISDTIQVRLKGNKETIYDIKPRAIGTGHEVLAALNGDVDSASATVSNIPQDARVFLLQTSIEVSPYASFLVLTDQDEIPDDTSKVISGMKILVTAEDSSERVYTIEVGGSSMPVVAVSDSVGYFTAISNQVVNLNGPTEWHVSSSKPLRGSMLNINSEDVWVYFEGVRPSAFDTNYLKQLTVAGATPVIDENIRLVQYGEGCVLIGHPSSYKPLECFTGQDFIGSSMKYGTYTFYRNEELVGMNDSIKSFKLKKGYMATFARNADGTGYSKVYIADNEDLEIDSLPYGLNSAVSYIRVFPWRWVTKKAWRGSPGYANRFGATSFYDYNNVASSTLDVEYVPMRHNPGWNSYSNFLSQRNCTHALGYNEPDNSVDDGFSSVQGAIDSWPKLLESGLRLGSPATTDGGLSWLYEFLDKCEALNYRVDFVAWHFYRAGYTPLGFYNVLKDIHERTGRSIWLTEWNNGCNWTYSDSNPAPSFDENGEVIDAFTAMLDTTSFVERYFVWDGCLETQRMFYSDNVTMTPAGEAYRDQVSEMAYNKENDINLPFIELPDKAFNPSPRHNGFNISLDTILSWEPGKEFVEKHRVYFGKMDAISFRNVQVDTFFVVNDLEPNAFYQWRIDEVYGSKTTRGDVWRFSTIKMVSINEQSLDSDELEVYPVPVANILYFQGLQKPETIEIFNLSGTKVMAGYTAGQLDVSALPKGTYLIKVDGYRTKTIVKNQ